MSRSSAKFAIYQYLNIDESQIYQYLNIDESQIYRYVSKISLKSSISLKDQLKTNL